MVGSVSVDIGPDQSPVAFGKTSHMASLSGIAFAVYFVAAMLDGFDAQIVAFLAPTLARSWHVPPSDFGIVFSIGLLGLTIGGVTIAPLADRFGRRLLLTITTFALGLTTLGSAWSSGIVELTWWRFTTGLSLGAVLPVLIALVHESSGPRARAWLVPALMTGFPIGGFVGGIVTAWSLNHMSWQALVAGLGALAMLLALFLAAVTPARSRTRAPQAGAGSPLGLFRDRRAVATLIIWFLFFATLANMYSLGNWLPILLERNGLDPAQAVTVTALYNGGGAVGGIAVGALMGRFGMRVLAAGYLAAAAMLLVLQPLAGTLLWAMLLSFGIGIFITGGQACNNALTAAYYPGDIRSTGIGWAQSVGRSSSIIAPLFIASALAKGVADIVLFAAAAIAALASAGGVYLLLRQPRREAPAA